MQQIYTEHNYSSFLSVKYHQKVRDHCDLQIQLIGTQLKKPQPKCRRRGRELKRKIYLSLKNYCELELATTYSLRNQDQRGVQKYSQFANTFINDLQLLYYYYLVLLYY